MDYNGVQVEPQQEEGVLYDQKHQEYMRAALDIVC